MSNLQAVPLPLQIDPDPRHPLRFHDPHVHLGPAFGQGKFGAGAEAFARFFGTPQYLIGRTVLVALWVLFNVTGHLKFDPFPFILLNLVFSLQAAYAAPLILLAQTRQADRDKVLTEADALHREDLARASAERQELGNRSTTELKALVEANTELTRITRELSEKIEALTYQIHQRVVSDSGQQ